ncbi:unnamed protein product, partial [Gulo gulo]
KPAPAKVETKSKKASEKNKSSNKKVQIKGKGEQRENRLKWLTKNEKESYLHKMEKLKMRRIRPQMKQEKKKPSWIGIIHIPCLITGPGIPSSTIQRNIYFKIFTYLRERENMCTCLSGGGTEGENLQADSPLSKESLWRDGSHDL